MAAGNIIAELVNSITFKVDDQSIQRVNRTVNSLKSTITRALGTIGIGLSIAGLNSIVESYQKMNREMAYVLQKSQDLGKTQKDILEAADDARTSYQNMVSVVEALHSKNQKLFPIEDAIKFGTEAQKLLVLSGKSESEAAALQRSLASVMGQGKITTSMLQSFASNAPILVDSLAESLGVTRDRLYEMADAGEVTAETMKRAVLNMTDSIDQAFDNLEYTLSDVLRSIRNQWAFFVSDLDETLKISQTINKFLMSLVNRAKASLGTLKNNIITITNALGGTANMLKTLVALVGAFTLVTRWKNIIMVLTNVVKLFSAGSIAALGMMAVVAILFLLVDDFIAFMQGRDSVIGYAFQQAGIDAEEMRQKIVNIWENLKTFFGGVWEKIQERLAPALETIKGWFEDTFGSDIFDDLGTGLEGVINFLERLSGTLAENEDLQQTLADIAIGIGAIWLAATIAMGVFVPFGKAIGAVMTAFQYLAPVLEATWGLLSNPIVIIFALILALTLLKGKFSSIFEGVKGLLDKFAGWFEEKFGFSIQTQIDNIKEWLTNLGSFLDLDFKTQWETVWGAIQGYFESIWKGIELAAINSVNAIVDWVNGKITEVIGGLNGLSQFLKDISAGWIDLGKLNPEDFLLKHIEYEGAGGSTTSASASGTEHGGSSGSFGTGNNKSGIRAWSIGNGQWKTEDGTIISKRKSQMEAQGYVIVDSPPGNAQGNYVLPNNPHPVIVGDNRTEPEIISPVSKMIAAVRTGLATSGIGTAIRTLANARYAGASTVYGPTNSRSVTQSVNINNTFNGERAIQQNAARIMDKSAGDITAELARALSYQF